MSSFGMIAPEHNFVQAPMKIYLMSIGNPDVCENMKELHSISAPRLHQVCDDPDAADLILVVGHWDGTWKQSPGAVTRDPVIRRYPDKCYAYSEDDRFLPLLPGVYTSAAASLSARLGRVRNYCYISRWRKERRHLVSRQQRPKRLLFSFLGAATAEVRTRLYRTRFQRKDVLVEDTSYYSHYGVGTASDEQRTTSQARYAETLAESHFLLCPRGGGRGSMRLFEAMETGVCPVLIADGFLLPYGPSWEKFLVCVREDQIDDLERILAPLEAESSLRGRLAHEAWYKWFAPQLAFNQIVSHCLEIRQQSRIREKYFRLLWPWMKVQHYLYYGTKKLWKIVRQRLLGKE